MQLNWSWKYRKQIRWGLAGIAATVAAVAAISLSLRRSTQEAEEKPSAILAPQVVRATRKLEYTESNRGRQIFKLKAAKYLEFKNGINTLEGIEAVNFGRDGGRRDLIRSDYSDYDVSAERVVFRGGVLIKTTEGTEIRSDQVEFEKGTQIAKAPESFRVLTQDLTATGTGLSYNFKTRETAISQDARLLVQSSPDGQQIDLASDRFRYFPDQGLLWLEGHAWARVESQFLEASVLEVRLWGQSGRVERLLARQNARYHPEGEGGEISLSGQTLDLQFQEQDRRPSQVQASGSARFSLRRGDESQELEAPTIRSDFQKAGAGLERIEAGENARLEISSGGRKEILTGKTLLLEFGPEGESLKQIIADRSLLNLPLSRIQLGASRLVMRSAGGPGDQGLESLHAFQDVRMAWSVQEGRVQEIRGDQAVLQNRAESQELEEAQFTGNASLEWDESGARRSVLSHQITLQFGPGNILSRLVAEPQPRVTLGTEGPGRPETMTGKRLEAGWDSTRGDIQSLKFEGNFLYQGATRRARADRATYEGGSGRLSLKGNPVLWEEDSKTTAEQIVLLRETNVLEAEGQVKTLLRSAGEATVPLPARDQPLVILARELKVEGKVAFYSGRARVVRGGDFVEADRVRLSGSPREFSAEGQVISHFYRAPQNGPSVDRVDITSSVMHYLPERGRATFEGGVQAQFQSYRLESDRLHLFFAQKDPSSIERAAGEGRVRLHGPQREGIGDRVEYFVHARKVVLAGNLAQFVDKTRGKTVGRQLTFYLDDDRLLVHS